MRREVQVLVNQFSLFSMSMGDAAVRILVAAVCGAALGWSRERLGKPAGLRTHMMVALGAATFSMLGLELLVQYSPQYEGAQIDPTRIIEGVVGGIGFLGAGTIIQSRGNVEGVTTAANVWVAGAVGIACGLASYAIAGLAVGLALIIMTALGVLERKLGTTESSDRS